LKIKTEFDYPEDAQFIEIALPDAIGKDPHLLVACHKAINQAYKLGRLHERLAQAAHEGHGKDRPH
jgi:hypothetical protein